MFRHSVGCHFIFWIADWFALLNGKMDSDMKKIRLAGDYMIEVLDPDSAVGFSHD